MKQQHFPARTYLATAVSVHLVISIVHGAAHAGANVLMSFAANLFVFIVILAGPVIGLALTWRAARLGNWLIAITLTASLVFGVVNHFVLASPDHVAHVDPRWRLMFTSTAILLAGTELLGSAVAIRLIRERSVS